MTVCEEGHENVAGTLVCEQCGRSIHYDRPMPPPAPEEFIVLIEQQTGSELRIQAGQASGDPRVGLRMRGKHWYIGTTSQARELEVDGQLVSADVEVRISERSSIRIGHARFRVRIESNDETREPVIGPEPRTETARPRVLGDLIPGHRLPRGHVIVKTLHAHETDRTGVYLANDRRGSVIVKIWPADHPPKPSLIDSLRAVEHPNVAAIYDIFEDNRLWYEVTEYCGGGSLEQYIRQGGLRAKDIEWLVKGVVPALNEAIFHLHSHEIVHRDIKPANVLLRDDRSLALIDFDIAKHLSWADTSRVSNRGMAGTWEFAAPEIFPGVDEQGKQYTMVQRASDYYSLGMTLLALIEGATPLTDNSYPEIEAFYRRGKVVTLPDKLPQRLDVLLRGLLVRDVGHRWGYEETNRWNTNSNTQTDLQKASHFGETTAAWKYTLKGDIATSLPQLAALMLKDPKEAASRLLSRISATAARRWR